MARIRYAFVSRLHRLVLAMGLALGLVMPGAPYSAGVAAATEKASPAPERTVVVSVSKGFAPYYFVDGAGEIKGFAIDIGAEIQTITGLRFEYQIFDKVRAVLPALRDGSTEVNLSIGITPKRSAYLDFTRPYETIRISHFIRKSAVGIEKATDLDSRKVGVVRINRGRSLLESRGHAKLVIFEGLEEALFALLSGAVDSVAYPENILLKSARAAGIDHLIKPIGPPLLEVKRAIAVAKGHPQLLAKLDAAVGQFIGSPAHKRIIAKWFGEPQSFWSKKKVTIAGAILAALFLFGFLIYRNRAVSRFNRELRGTIQAKDAAENELRNLHANLEALVDNRTRSLQSEIAERERAEVALRESEDSYRTLLALMHDGVLVAYDGRMSFVNEAAMQLTGYNMDELSGMEFHQLLTPHGVEIWRKRRQDRLAGLSVESQHEIEFLHKDGKTVKSCLINIKRYNGPDGSEAVLGTFMDITDLKHAETSLRNAQKMEVLGNLTGGAAHSLNNLLVPIVGLGEILKEQIEDNEDQGEMIDAMMQAAESARQLVARMLTFSRQDDPQQEVIDPYKIMRKSLDLMKPSIPSTITIWEDLDQTAGAIFADPVQTETVLINLITNAAAAMKGDVGTIKVGLTRAESRQHGLAPLGDENFIKMTVSDDGPGMDEEVRERIFDPFFTTKEVGEGTGLGLSMSHGIVQRHGGHIDVESAPGLGTTFEIYLPICDAPDAANATPG
ncbi:MAG: transporter substrate-binding domain-containing protein [Rhodospirillaceae bacterium]|nr:transporter substrate-binding domain-containing protein [Rhodospirillaceae bacterium]